MFSRSKAGAVRPVRASSAAARTGRALVDFSKGDGSARSFTDRAISLRFAPPKILFAISSGSFRFKDRCTQISIFRANTVGYAGFETKPAAAAPVQVTPRWLSSAAFDGHS